MPNITNITLNITTIIENTINILKEIELRILMLFIVHCFTFQQEWSSENVKGEIGIGEIRIRNDYNIPFIIAQSMTQLKMTQFKRFTNLNLLKGATCKENSNWIMWNTHVLILGCITVKVMYFEGASCRLSVHNWKTRCIEVLVVHFETHKN